MQLETTLAELRERRAKLDQVIAALETLEAKPKSRRGRKFMLPAERREVSERMKRFWAKQKERQV